MIDFALSSAELDWRDQSRLFIKNFVLPRTDLDTHGHFPWDLYQKAFEAGFVTSMIPEALGGKGRTSFEVILATEEFGYGDLGVTTSTFLLKLATSSILNFGTPDQKKRWIQPLTKELRFAAHAWTEPEGSSNLFNRPATTTARPVPGGFILNGTKSTISNATVASLYTVFARLDPGPGGLSCFVIPRDTPGLEVSNPYRKMGQRAADTGQIKLHDVFVPSQDLVGQHGQGGQIAMRAVRESRIGLGAMAVGVARRARDLVKLHGHSRTTSTGEKLIAQQDYRFRIAEMETEIEMVRALTWRACQEIASSGPEANKFSSCTKLAAGRMAAHVTNQAVEMLGAQGYLESGLAEKLLRDAKILQIYEGPEPIQKMLIADSVTRLGGRGLL